MDKKPTVHPLQGDRTPLADYLLDGDQGRLFLIACPRSDLSWPDESEGAQDVVRLDTLEEAETLLKVSAASDEPGSDLNTAVLNIQEIESNLAPVIGQAVRAFPNRLIVYTHLEHAPDSLFFSLGFRKLNVSGDAMLSEENRWYEFRLSHYKQSPDWLNARFWANPARFELDEDLDIYIDSDEEE